MHADIAAKRDGLIALCRRFDVERLEVFGSAARGTDFEPGRGDADFLVVFKAGSAQEPLAQSRNYIRRRGILQDATVVYG